MSQLLMQCCISAPICQYSLQAGSSLATRRYAHTPNEEPDSSTGRPPIPWAMLVMLQHNIYSNPIECLWYVKPRRRDDTMGGAHHAGVSTCTSVTYAIKEECGCLSGRAYAHSYATCMERPPIWRLQVR